MLYRKLRVTVPWVTDDVPITKGRHQVKCFHDDVIKWKHFPCYWPFVRGINRSPVNSAHKGQWRGALIFSLICVWINGWVNYSEAGDFRRYHAHYDVSVMYVMTRSWIGEIYRRVLCLSPIKCCHAVTWLINYTSPRKMHLNKINSFGEYEFYFDIQCCTSQLLISNTYYIGISDCDRESSTWIPSITNSYLTFLIIDEVDMQPIWLLALRLLC